MWGTLWSWPSAPELETPHEGRTLAQYVAEILETPDEGRTLAQYAAEILNLNPGADGPEEVAQLIIKRLPKFVFHAVTEAFEESEKTEDQDLEKLERLHPQAALRHAVLLALEEERRERSGLRN